MMAVSDPEKVKLLLERGANVNALSAAKGSALLIASKIRSGTASARLLLQHGADPRLTPRSGDSRAPLGAAALVGNAELLPALHAAGDAVQGAMRDSVRNGFLDVVRTLLDLGVPVDEPDPSGITPLARAATSNDIDIATLLIQRGADVNKVDKYGYSPIMYAASVDYGDSRMIGLLLKAGARLDTVSKNGQTALALATTYGNQRFVPALSTRKSVAE